MHSRSVRLGLAAVLVLSLQMPAPASAGAMQGTPAPTRESALRDGMRKLWEDHVTWTRLVIVAAAAGLPDLDATTQRLLRNQADIGDAIKPYYGDDAGEKLTSLLRTHILEAAAILAAARANEPARLDSTKKAWYANGEEIAGFLHGANPASWPLADLQGMMRQHLDLTLAEAVDELQGRYAQSVADYDRVHDEILQMADALSAGLLEHAGKESRVSVKRG